MPKTLIRKKMTECTFKVQLIHQSLTGGNSKAWEDTLPHLNPLIGAGVFWATDMKQHKSWSVYWA